MVSSKQILKRWQALKSERSSWIGHWREISEHLHPRSGSFMTSERNKGNKKHNKIYDNTATRSLNVLAAGLMGGLTSPSRPWFKLAASDSKLNKDHAVKIWLQEVENMMLAVFARSNLYGALHNMYLELGAYGTAACAVLPDYNDVLRCYPLTAGEYAIATDHRGEANTLYREFEKTVGEVVDEFGLDNVSERTRQLYQDGNYDKWITLLHAVEPRRERDKNRRDSINMPYRSVYLELGTEQGKILRESGFTHFPVLAPRWQISGGDIYGSSPAMNALGDIKQLQHEQLRKSQAIDFQTNPPLFLPNSMKGSVNNLPGGISYYDPSQGNAIHNAFNVPLNLSALLDDIQDVRNRINAAFYTDLFLMLSGSTQNMTATEVAERHEEKMLMLGPVLERLQNELIDPLISIAFDYLMQAQALPPPPEVLQGSDVNVVLVSILAQAQKAIGVNSIDRFIAATANFAQIKPEILDNINPDALVEVYSEALGTDTRIIAPPDQVQALREQRQQAQQMQEQAAMMQQGADISKSLAQAQQLAQGAQSAA